MLEYKDDALIMSQIRTAEFARMSTSKQLSLWAILRAQLSSKRQLEAQQAQTASPEQNPVPASPPTQEPGRIVRCDATSGSARGKRPSA
jgi:hypothetical protein